MLVEHFRRLADMIIDADDHEIIDVQGDPPSRVLLLPAQHTAAGRLSPTAP
jgi:hypothetical protein